MLHSRAFRFLLLLRVTSVLFPDCLRTIPEVSFRIAISITFVFDNFFISQARSRHWSIFSFSFMIHWNHEMIHNFSNPQARSRHWSIFSFSFMIHWNHKMLSMSILFFIFSVNTGSALLVIICLPVSPGECYSTKFQGFWFWHRLFVSFMTFQYLAQFPVGHFSYPIMATPVFFCVLSIFALVTVVLMKSFCAAI